jgi:hypothetical protein
MWHEGSVAVQRSLDMKYEGFVLYTGMTVFPRTDWGRVGSNSCGWSAGYAFEAGRKRQ